MLYFFTSFLINYWPLLASAGALGYLFYSVWRDTRPKDLWIEHKETGARFLMKAKYSSEAVQGLLDFLDEQDAEMAHRNQYLPDEYFYPTGRDYEGS